VAFGNGSGKMPQMKSSLPLTLLIAAGCLLLGSCNYEIPITGSPTRRVEPQLLGTWVAQRKDSPKPDEMKVRQLDSFVYIISYNGDLYRAYHSDVDKVPFVTVQDIESADRKYAYFTWQLSADGTVLTIQPVSTRLIPPTLPNSAAVQQLLKQFADHPNLLLDPVQFTHKGVATPAPRR
jgi:hypothetical protein